MTKSFYTAKMSSLETLNGNILWLIPDIWIKIVTLVTLIFIWRGVMTAGANVDMTTTQMLSYTFAATLLADMLVVQTPASGWLSDGVLMRLYGRPQTVLGQLVWLTVGRWIPMLLFFSLPMALAAPFLGVRLWPASLWFFPSLLLCISLGFAIDILFACLSIKLRNMNWLVSRIRTAIVALLSGTVIPIQFMPPGLARLLQYQPFASQGGATLCIFVGTGNGASLLGLQLFWNLVLWPCALLVFKKSQEGVVSYGG